MSAHSAELRLFALQLARLARERQSLALTSQSAALKPRVEARPFRHRYRIERLPSDNLWGMACDLCDLWLAPSTFRMWVRHGRSPALGGQNAS
jgi:hypothetical protein